MRPLKRGPGFSSINREYHMTRLYPRPPLLKQKRQAWRLPWYGLTCLFFFHLGCPAPGEGNDTLTPDPCDADGDQADNLSCGGLDCDDNDASIHPGAEERCDAVDRNCDGLIHFEAIDSRTFFLDEDQDGFGTPNSVTTGCHVVWPYVENNTDCNDSSARDNPTRVWYRDQDGDGLGDPNDTVTGCLQPDGYVDDQQDPDDTDGTGIGCWQHVTVGRDFSCGLKQNGDVSCWGSNSMGQLNVPATVAETVQLVAGYHHVCALDGQGLVTCWGGESESSLDAPEMELHSISCGLNFCCGLNDDSEDNMRCWGDNQDGQSTPPEGVFSTVSAGIGRHACALDTAGVVQCWGLDMGLSGQPSPLITPEGTFQAVAAGYYYSCAIDEQDRPVCFGANGDGQSTPPDLGVRTVHAGAEHTCAIDLEENIECWGDPSLNRLDDPIGNFVQLSTGQLHSCAVTNDFVIQCWGDAESGKLFPSACQ